MLFMSVAQDSAFVPEAGDNFARTFTQTSPLRTSTGAAETVVHATPDGHTLLWVTQANTINVTLYAR